MEYVFKTEDTGPDLYSGIYAKSNGGTESMYRKLISLLPKDLTDKFQIICSRVREIDSNKKQILWLHDRVEDPENRHLADPILRKRFAKLVFVSYQQFAEYRLAYGIRYDEAIILRNAVDPFACELQRPSDTIRLIYHTTPHRGLEILIPVFKYLYDKVGPIHLDVFSSFKIYGEDWSERDRPYSHLIDECRSHSGITYHGSVDNSVVREALTKSHIFAFPSIWPETSCIAAIEAQCAGVLTVCSDLGALPETVSDDYGLLYHYNEDINYHAALFADTLKTAIDLFRKNDEHLNKLLDSNMRIFNEKYGWPTRIVEWERLLRSL